MQCPKCNKEGCKYTEKRNLDRKTRKDREDFNAKCNKCGWIGTV